MPTQPIQNEAEHDAAIARITQLMGSKLGTQASDELEALAAAVDAYETEHFPMDEPNAETLRRFLAEQRGASE